MKVTSGKVGVMTEHKGSKRRGDFSGRKRPAYEHREGTTFTASGRPVFYHRFIDRVKNFYREVVFDLGLGKTLHYDEGKASDHRGHGSDKKE